MKKHNPRQVKKIFSASAIRMRTAKLIADAERAGMTVTIETVPQKPLAMGHHRMAFAVRNRLYRK
jgi:hypothetical protein